MMIMMTDVSNNNNNDDDDDNNNNNNNNNNMKIIEISQKPKRFLKSISQLIFYCSFDKIKMKSIRI